MIWEGKDIIESAKKIIGYTNPGALSGHFCVAKGGNRNICHCSETVDKANEEIMIWFDTYEINTWHNQNDKVWVMAESKG